MRTNCVPESPLCESTGARGNAMPANKLTEDMIGKVFEAADAGDVYAHRILMLALRSRQETPLAWDKATKAAAVDWLEQAVATSAHAESDLKTNSDLWLEQNAPT